MSYKDKLNSKFKITTGDGREWDVLSKTESFKASYEFNISEFEFPEVVGTKVDRRLRKGNRYPLEFYFQGENNVDQMLDFLLSTEDRRPWIVLHPFYGRISGHPTSIEYDNSGIHSVKFNILFIESIEEDGPKTTLNPYENSPANVLKANEAIASSFSSTVVPTVSDVQVMKANVDDLYKQGSTSISGDMPFNKYVNFYSTALSKINGAFNDVSGAIIATQSFIGYPALFEQQVKQRLKLLISQADTLSKTVQNLITPNEKKIFESQKGTLISAIINTATTPFGSDYQNSVDVIDVVEVVLNSYNDFIGELQVLQSEDPTQVDSYIPDVDVITNLNYAVNYAVSNLFEIAMNAQQERIVYLEEDSNPIILAHRFYGLLPDDSTITRFMETNNVLLAETLQLKAGRKIVYYV